MTVIAARVEETKITMACDSLVSRGWHTKSTGYPCKLISGSDFVAGLSGSAVVMPMLAAYAKDHSIGSGGELRIAEWCFEFLGFCKKHTGEWKQDASLLVAHHSGLYAVEDWMPIGVTDYCAIGSGFEHAEAAMYLGKTPAEAADVAINMSFGCGGKIVERTVDLRRAVS